MRIENGILIVVSKRFKGQDHAGRGSFQLAVYASDEQKAKHELKELEMWLDWAVEKRILTDQEKAELRAGNPNKIKSLGDRLREKANTGTVKEKLYWQNEMRKFDYIAHEAGLRAEGTEEKILEANRFAAEAKISEISTPINNFDVFISSQGPTFGTNINNVFGNSGGGNQTPPTNNKNDLNHLNIEPHLDALIQAKRSGANDEELLNQVKEIASVVDEDPSVLNEVALEKIFKVVMLWDEYNKTNEIFEELQNVLVVALFC